MNIPLDRKLAVPATPTSCAPREEATAVALGKTLSVVFVDRPAGRRQRMRAQQAGQPVPRPFITAGLALRSGGTRHVMLLPQSIETVLAHHLLLYLDDLPAAQIDPNWLQPPQEELAALTAQLAPRGLQKLLRMLLATAASLFTSGVQADLGDAILRLMDLGDVPPISPVARTDMGDRMLVSYPVPGGEDLGDASAAIALLGGQLGRLKGFHSLVEGKLLHLLLPPGFSSALFLIFPETVLRLAAPSPSLRRLGLPVWVEGRSDACRNWLLSKAGGGNVIRPPEFSPGLTKPAITIRHLSSVSGGLLHMLELADPARIVRKLVLEHQGRRVELTPCHGADGTAILAGFTDMPDEVPNHGPCRIHALSSSGRLRLMAEAQVVAHDGSIPPGFEDAWLRGDETLEPLSRARRRVRRPFPPSAIQHFGPQKPPRLRIVTSIGNSADLIRARAAMILAEDPRAAVEVVCTMAEGPLAIQARQALAQTAAIYGIPHRLVLLPDLANAGERLRRALMEAQDVPALVLGADVLPEGPGWLAFWLRRLRRRDALAPVLLAADGSIAATREGEDPYRGLPAAHGPGLGRVSHRPLVDCLALGPGGIARLLASGTPHPNAAVWIASALGGIARTETRHPFRLFGAVPKPSRFMAALAETEFAMIEKVRE